MTITYELIVPRFGTTINYKSNVVGRKQDGFQPNTNKIEITSMTQQDAEEYGEKMKAAFLDHWKKLTENK